MGFVNLARNAVGPWPSDFTAANAILHPDFKPPSVYNDIALVELDRPVRTSGSYVNRACLQTERNITEPNWSALGWGETSHHGPIAEHLQVMELREANHTICKKSYLNAGERKLDHGVDDDSQLCAGKENVDTCLGDSGGPLQTKHTKHEKAYTIIGITSFGKPCLLTNKPGVYTRVSHYVEWIENIVWPEKE